MVLWLVDARLTGDEDFKVLAKLADVGRQARVDLVAPEHALDVGRGIGIGTASGRFQQWIAFEICRSMMSPAPPGRIGSRRRHSQMLNDMQSLRFIHRAAHWLTLYVCRGVSSCPGICTCWGGGAHLQVCHALEPDGFHGSRERRAVVHSLETRGNLSRQGETSEDAEVKPCVRGVLAVRPRGLAVI